MTLLHDVDAPADSTGPTGPAGLSDPGSSDGHTRYVGRDITGIHSADDGSEAESGPLRMIAIWCPDWPVAAAMNAYRATAVTSSRAGASATARADGLFEAPTGLPRTLSSPAPASRIGTRPSALLTPTQPVSTTELPVAVVTGNHVVACSHPARAAGVRRGMRRREAQSRCPQLVVLPRDEAMEARSFEPLVAAIEAIAPGVEITRPGLAAIGARGPSRYFGGEQSVLHTLSRSLGELSADVLLGVGDGSFAAEQAARRGLVVPPGQSAEFLAELPVDIIDAPELVDLLRRLGIRTLGAFAGLPARDVLTRFGATGAWIHRQCGGRDARPIAARPPAAEHSVDVVFEPALERIDTVAFSVRTSAERFINGLLDHGLACTCLEVLAETENGEQSVRRWRQTGVLSAVDVVDRIRWQLEGWLNGRTGQTPAGAGERPTSGVTLIRLVAAQCVPTGVHQQSLWGATGEDDERAHRALARVQTLLGHGSVLTAVADGGRDPAQRTTLVPWGDEPVPRHGPERPWPGQLPAPAPSVLLDPPRVVAVLDAAGRPVTVTPRGAVPVAPAFLDMSPGRAVADRSAADSDPGTALTAITAWAGPWPVDDNWWTGTAPGSTPMRRARFQLVDVLGRAYLAVYACALDTGTDISTPADGVRAPSAPSTPSTPSAPGTPRTPGASQWTLEAVYD